MKQREMAAAFALTAMLGVAHAADVAEGAPEAAASKTCPQEHSLALCIAKAAKVAGAMKDMTPADLKVDMGRRTGDALWYAGAAAGSGTGIFRPAKGVPRGAEVGMFVAGLLASLGKGSDILGRNLAVAWMPAEMASTKEDANAKAAAIFLKATLDSFEGSTVKAEPLPEHPDVSRYFITGGLCEGHECVLTPVMKRGDSGETMGTRSFKAKAPDFLGGRESYRFGTYVGALYALTLRVDGKDQTQTYLQELSRRLPDWMYVVSSPQVKLPDGSMFNEGQNVPVMYSKGAEMYFAFPDLAPVGKSGATALPAGTETMSPSPTPTATSQ